MNEELQKLLCTLEIVKTNVKGRHWTVKGERYVSWHRQFDEIFNVLCECSDTVAELIVQAGDVPFHAPSQFLKYSMCDEQLSVLDCKGMIIDTDNELGQIIRFIDDTVKIGIFTPSVENDLTAIASKLKHERMFCSQTLE